MLEGTRVLLLHPISSLSQRHFVTINLHLQVKPELPRSGRAEDKSWMRAGT